MTGDEYTSLAAACLVVLGIIAAVATWDYKRNWLWERHLSTLPVHVRGIR